MSKYRIKKVVNKNGLESFYVQMRTFFGWKSFTFYDKRYLLNPFREFKFNTREECLNFIENDKIKEVISYEYC